VAWCLRYELPRPSNGYNTLVEPRHRPVYFNRRCVFLCSCWVYPVFNLVLFFFFFTFFFVLYVWFCYGVLPERSRSPCLVNVVLSLSVPSAFRHCSEGPFGSYGALTRRGTTERYFTHPSTWFHLGLPLTHGKPQPLAPLLPFVKPPRVAGLRRLRFLCIRHQPRS